MPSDVELVLDSRMVCGEGPLWDGRSGRLWLTDIPSSRLHSYDPATGEHEIVPMPEEVGTIVPRASGGFVLAVTSGFAALSGDGALSTLAEVEKERPGNRMNDGKCDSAGRLWAGTMAFDGRNGAGTLYTLEPDLTVRPHLRGLGISNGMAWSSDDSTFYFTDSTTYRIDAFGFDVASGTLHERRTVVQFDEADGLPDGLCLDSNGDIWVAMFGGAAVRRYAPDGQLVQRVDLPVPNVTCCAFAGPDLTDLYITTARSSLTEDQLRQFPESGAVYRCRPGVKGTPPYAFAG